jgi:uncharacterized membrane protein
LTATHEPSGRQAAPVAPRGTGFPWVLLAIIAVGAVLRFYRLGYQSFWIDELLTIHAADLGESLSFPEIFWNIQGPLHATLVNLVGRVSTGEVALRSMSAVAGVALIPVTYLLGKELVDRTTGLIAALLIAISPFSVWYSQELRNYSFVMFFSAVSTLVVWRIVEKNGRGWTLYVVTVVLGILSNFATGFLIVAHNVFAAGRAFSDRRLLGKWLAAYAAVVVLLIPSALGLLRWARVDSVSERVVVPSQADDEELLRGETTFTPAAIPYSFVTMAYGSTFGPSLRELHTGSPARAYMRHAALVAPAVLLMAAAWLLGLKRLLLSRRALALVLAIVVVPLAGAAALAILNIKPFNPRYVSVMLPVLVVLAAAGIATLRRVGSALLCGFIALFCVVSLANYYYRGDYRREDVRGAVRYVEEQERPRDLVLAPVVGDVFDFYFRGDARLFIIYPGQAASDEEVSERIEAAIEGHGRLWFLDSRLWHADPSRRVPAYLDEHFARVDETSFDGVRVVLYRLTDRAGDGPDEPPATVGGP